MRAPSRGLVVAVAACLLTVAHAHEDHDDGGKGGLPISGAEPPPVVSGAAPCIDGVAAGYPCAKIDLLSFLPLSMLGGGRANTVWGWTDAVTQREYALLGRTNGTSFVDITDPEHPLYLGNLPPHSTSSTWREMKVYADHVFIVSEAVDHGLQVFDLRQLRAVASPPVTFTETAHYSGFSRAHNIAVNEESGFVYAVGSNTCAGGLHMVDVRVPTAPAGAGCFSADGYTHDTQCVIYRGPDSRYVDHELCFSSNTNTLTIVDVSNKSAPVMLARKGYSGRGYTHQGWLTDDHAHFILDDEQDEQKFGVNTRTHVWDVSNVSSPVHLGFHEGPGTAIDHNLYVRDGYVYQANYRSGLRILDLISVASATFHERAFFDIYPPDDVPSFNAAWNNYPFFPSGVVVVSGIEQGLYVLRPNLAAGTSADLISARLTAPPIAGAGVPLSVTHVTENQGTGNAAETTTRLFLSADALLQPEDAPLMDVTVDSLGPGGSRKDTVSPVIPADTNVGAYYVIAQTDAASAVDEEIENNNVRVRLIRVGPDLTVTTLAAPNRTSAGSAIELTDHTSNAGGGTAGASVTRFYLSRDATWDASDSVLGERGVPSLAPGARSMATTTVVIPAGTPPKKYFVLGLADDDRGVAETLEENNVTKHALRIE